MTTRAPSLSLALFALMGLATAAFADEPTAPKMPPPAPEPHISAFGDRDRTCMEWTNGCQICTRPTAGAPQCSTPGIACTPSRVTCSLRK